MANDATALPQTWDPQRYAENARFVAELGMPVVALLDPQPGERILDLGCGDGFLTAKLKEMGARVIGVDASAAQIAAAVAMDLDARVIDGQALPFAGEFDAVFSNAALHWMKDADAVIGGVWRALVPGGRFVAECGGAGCVATIRAALGRALGRRGIDADRHNPWRFASAEDYQARLLQGGFVVESIALFARPTPLPGEMTAWLQTFAESFLDPLPPTERPVLLAEVQDDLRPALCDPAGHWTADYTRVRFRAIKSATATT
ncbi:MAG TPA: class I SAM-dependent methyltransferase [Polyangia bacterium]|jgi:SAM-dependent methyltransferase|nr:class I SAM-dependent methyltransferase [Polyangia bacterium]